jgi:hypothetical protein
MKRVVLSSVVVAGLGVAAFPAPASAAILIEAPANVSCGRPIRTGVWNRPDGRPPVSRSVTIQIRSARGLVLWSRRVTAPSTWRYFRYTGRCGRTSRGSYANPQFGTDSYRIKVRERR